MKYPAPAKAPKAQPAHVSADGKLSASVKYIGGGEYAVWFYRDGVRQKDADYFTNDKDDAIGTAKHFVNGPAPLSKLEFAAIVTPLLARNIAFELALAGHMFARLTWNVGDTTITAVTYRGETVQVALPCEN